jgi:hypothetical protein
MTNQTNYRTILLEKINKLLAGQLTVPEFQDEYYNYFLDSVPDDGLTKAESMFFGLIQEKLDWTTETPGKEDKKYKYKSYKEYTEWVRHVTELFLKDGADSEKNYDQYCNLWVTNK